MPDQRQKTRIHLCKHRTEFTVDAVGMPAPIRLLALLALDDPLVIVDLLAQQLDHMDQRIDLAVATGLLTLQLQLPERDGKGDDGDGEFHG